MGPHPPPPPRRKPGEKDKNEAPRKGRCLIRDGQAYSNQKSRYQRKPADAGQSEIRSARSSDYHLLNGIRVGRGFFWATMSALSLIVLATLSVPLILLMQSERDTASLAEVDEPVAKPQAGQENAEQAANPIQGAPLRDRVAEMKSNAMQRIDQAPSNLEEIIQDYSQATGLDQARTLSMEGKARTNNRDYEINLFVKAPFQVRQVLSQEGVKITSVFDGQVGQLEVENFIRNRVDRRVLTPTQNVGLIMSSVLGLPLWQNQLDPAKLEDGGNETINGEVYRVIINRTFPQCDIKHYLDVDRMVERMRVAKKDGEEPIDILVKFLDYTSIGDFYMPMRIEVIEIRAIEIRSIIDVEKWSFNQGLLPSLFVVDAG